TNCWYGGGKDHKLWTCAVHTIWLTRTRLRSGRIGSHLFRTLNWQSRCLPNSRSRIGSNRSNRQQQRCEFAYCGACIAHQRHQCELGNHGGTEVETVISSSGVEAEMGCSEL